MSASGNKIKSCFEGLIAIDGLCGEAAPSTGIFLKKLGVTRSEMSGYLTKEYSTVDQLFQDKYDTAIDNIVNAVNTYFQPRYKAFSIIENKRAGIFQNNLKMIAGEASRMKGINFRLDNRESYLDLILPSVSLQLNYTGEIQLKMLDLIQGKLIDTIKIDVTPNDIITTQIDKIIKSEKRMLNAFIGYDAEGISANQTQLQIDGTCCGNDVISNSFMTIRAASIGSSEQKIDQNLKSETDTGGLSLVYSFACNHHDWICSISNRLALAIAYETCVGIMEHAKYQAGKEQITIRVGTGEARDQIEERRNLYQSKSTKILNQILTTVTLPSDDRCFTCRQNNRTAVLIP